MDKFQENEKFWCLSGTINRRNFISNFIVVEILESLLFVTPIFYMILIKPEMLSLLKDWSNPLWYSIWFGAIGILSCILYFPSIVRRVRDITEKDDNNYVYLISTALTVIIYMSYTPVGTSFLGKVLSLFVILSLAFSKGRITGEKPKSEIIKFNWGAFFGTWVWGLFNKTPITLLFIPLAFTTGWFPFMVLCGLKGNEWAYKNKQYESLERFHSKQADLSIVLGVVMPILWLIFVVFSFIIASLGLHSYSESHPNFKNNLRTYYNRMEMSSVESEFDKIEVDSNEYKFYLNPQQWTSLNPVYKSSLLKNCANYALIKAEENNKNTEKQIYKILILSTFNNETLGGVEIKKEHIQKDELGSHIKNDVSSTNYKINNNPALP